jgi:hypothetical protein
MSTVSGGQGNIVTNGLVLNLDAANPRSYAPPYNGTTWQNIAPISSSLTGSLVGGVAYTGSNGGALVFDGVNDYVTGFDSISLNTTSSFSVEFWFNLTSFSDAYPSLIQLKTNSSFGWNLSLSQNGGYLGLTFGSTNNWSTIKTDNIPTVGVWNHVIVTYNGLGAGTISNYKTYLNNIEQTLSSAGGFNSTTQVNYIGTTNAASRGIDDFIGRISVCRIYNRALNASEVLQNFNATRARFGV